MSKLVEDLRAALCPHCADGVVVIDGSHPYGTNRFFCHAQIPAALIGRIEECERDSKRLQTLSDASGMEYEEGYYSQMGGRLREYIDSITDEADAAIARGVK